MGALYYAVRLVNACIKDSLDNNVIQVPYLSGACDLFNMNYIFTPLLNNCKPLFICLRDSVSTGAVGKSWSLQCEFLSSVKFRDWWSKAHEWICQIHYHERGRCMVHEPCSYYSEKAPPRTLRMVYTAYTVNVHVFFQFMMVLKLQGFCSSPWPVQWLQKLICPDFTSPLRTKGRIWKGEAKVLEDSGEFRLPTTPWIFRLCDHRSTFLEGKRPTVNLSGRHQLLSVQKNGYIS